MADPSLKYCISPPSSEHEPLSCHDDSRLSAELADPPTASWGRSEASLKRHRLIQVASAASPHGVPVFSGLQDDRRERLIDRACTQSDTCNSSNSLHAAQYLETVSKFCSSPILGLSGTLDAQQSFCTLDSLPHICL